MRARRRERDELRRSELDAKFVAAFAEAIGAQFPGCPEDERNRIAEHACLKSSGRVGRSAAAKVLAPETIRLAVVAHVRHVHTKYDELLWRYGDRELARAEVAGTLEEVVSRWATSSE